MFAQTFFLTTMLLMTKEMVANAMPPPDDDDAMPDDEPDEDHVKTKRHGKIGARYGKKGGMVQFCFDEDECKHVIMLKLFKLVEHTADGDVAQKAENFNKADFNWSEPLTETSDDGTERIKVQLNSNITVGKPADPIKAQFTMDTFIYVDAGFSMNGNQTLDIPKNALKFSISIKNWPWKNASNYLTFGLAMKVRTKGGKDGAKNPERKRGRGRDGKVSRFELGGGAFMDSPELCEIDGETQEVMSTLTSDIGNDGVLLAWSFPHFETSLFYDPVIGDTSVVEESDDDDDGNDGNKPTPTQTRSVATTLTTPMMMAGVLFFTLI